MDKAGELAARRRASGSLSGRIGGDARCQLRGGREFNQKAHTGKQIGSRTGPLRSPQTTAAIVVLTAAAAGAEGCFRACLRGCLGHPVMAVHRRLAGLERLAHAVHGFRVIRAGQRQRSTNRKENSQQKEFCSPTMHGFGGDSRAGSCRREQIPHPWRQHTTDRKFLATGF